MRVLNRQYLTAVVLLAVTCFLIFGIQNRKSSSSTANKLDEIPLEIGEWKGRDVTVEQSVYDILETHNLLVREYENSAGDKVAIAVVYSENNRASMHPPEICYVGGGVDLIEKGVVALPVKASEEFLVNKLVMKDKLGIIKAWYWFSTKTKFTPSYYRQQLSILFNGLINNHYDGALIRVSIRSQQQDWQYQEQQVNSFIGAILPSLERFLQKT
ncbi:MAG: EpsI family protein [Candidatus Omnitrophica bacterium]|nr:EpsI family protein [Candidatus Omnitrophota bacterium]